MRLEAAPSPPNKMAICMGMQPSLDIGSRPWNSSSRSDVALALDMLPGALGATGPTL